MLSIRLDFYQLFTDLLVNYFYRFTGTVKPVLTATSEQRPPVNNGQPDPQTSQTNWSFIGDTSE
jgi:hypothetical protein